MSVAVARAEPSLAGVGDYIELMKPRVMSLVVFTALVGLVLAPGHMHPVIAFTALLCIAVGAGAAGALNMWYDADIDARMARTAGRPIPAGVPMLPVVAGATETRRQILRYTLVLAPVGAMPWLLGYAGPLYGIAALLAGLAMIALAIRVRGEQRGYAASKQMFGFSILYL